MVNIDNLQSEVKNYIVRSYRDVIVITKFATRRASKAQSIVIYYNIKHTKKYKLKTTG